MIRTSLSRHLLISAMSLQVATAAAQETPAAAAPQAAESPAGAATPPPPAPYTPPSAAPAAPAANSGQPAAATPSAPPAEMPAEAPAVAPSSAAATAADPLMATAESLATTIEDVQVVGPWTEGERNGVWRTIMMQIPGSEDRYRFFVQQIERAQGALSILSTTEIKEIQGIEGAIVGYRADEPAAGETTGLTLFFDIVPSDGEIAETYELHFVKDAPYVFGPATN